MKWCTGQKATDDNLNWEGIDYFPDMALTSCNRGYYESLGYSIVPFAFFALKKPRPDKLTAIRDGNDIVLTYKQNGTVVKQARVTKHAKDKDDFLVGTAFALTKLAETMSGFPITVASITKSVAAMAKLDSSRHNTTPDKSTLFSKFEKLEAAILENTPDYILYHSDPRNLKAGDRVYTHYGNFVGEIETVDGLRYHLKYKAGSEDGYVWRMQSQLVGKIVPCGELHKGDEVLLKCGKIVKITRVSGPAAYAGDCCVNVSDTSIVYPRRAFGKLIRFKQEVPHA
jgi:hypothetical protein